MNSGKLNLLETSVPLQACNGTAYLYINTLRRQKAEFVYLKENVVFVFNFNFVTAYCL